MPAPGLFRPAWSDAAEVAVFEPVGVAFEDVGVVDEPDATITLAHSGKELAEANEESGLGPAPAMR